MAEPMVPADGVPTETTVLVTLEERASGDRCEAVLVRAAGGVRCWLNACRHFTDVPLDRGDGAVMRDGELLCTEHGAMFAAGSGRCTHGPCDGAVLPSVDVAVRDGAVVLTDGDYGFAARGGIDDGDDGMPSSTTPREF